MKHYTTTSHGCGYPSMHHMLSLTVRALKQLIDLQLIAINCQLIDLQLK